ncbi:MAG: MotA/TolQ/ExbB proton channel family protein [Planctomycetota bacterium]|nr:MotA/TolQ/ExbB proton channel family protein [Planctomycetota bacterium]
MRLITGHLLAQDSAGEGGVSVLEMIAAGGAIGYVIILLSVGALALVVRHMLQIRESSLAPADAVDAIHDSLAKGDVAGAIRYCDDEDNDSFLTRVVGAGLKRMRRSPFGALELKGAMEEAGQEQVARLYRSTDGLGLIAAIAPMLGLLGTVVGMVGAFDTISSAAGFARPDQLAGDISQALVTTLMGLTLAIPCMAAFTFFRNRIDALATSVAAIIEELTTHLDPSELEGGGSAGG